MRITMGTLRQLPPDKTSQIPSNLPFIVVSFLILQLIYADIQLFINEDKIFI
jgi:hypothetical protein